MPVIILSVAAAVYCAAYLRHCVKIKNAPGAAGALLLIIICSLAFALSVYTIPN